MGVEFRGVDHGGFNASDVSQPRQLRKNRKRERSAAVAFPRIIAYKIPSDSNITREGKNSWYTCFEAAPERSILYDFY